MQAAIRTSAQVRPGGLIEISDAQLPVGRSVDVIVLLPEAAPTKRGSILDVLARAPGRLLYQDAEHVDASIHQERDNWER